MPLKPLASQIGQARRTFAVPAGAWPGAADQAKDLGFDSLLVMGADALDPFGEHLLSPPQFKALGLAARKAGLSLAREIYLDGVWSEHPLATTLAPRAFLKPLHGDEPVDPRRPFSSVAGLARLRSGEDADLVEAWKVRLDQFRNLGFAQFAFRAGNLAGRSLAARLRAIEFDLLALENRISGRANSAFLVGDPESAFPRSVDYRRRALGQAALSPQGWVMWSGLDQELADQVKAINGLPASSPSSAIAVPRSLTGPTAAIEACYGPCATGGRLVISNRTGSGQPWRPELLGFLEDELRPLPAFAPTGALLAPHQTLVFTVEPRPPVKPLVKPNAAGARDRVVIQHVTPSIDGGAFAIKRVAGERLEVRADIFTDGHEQLSAELLFRAEDEADWRRTPMTALPNDAWEASTLSGRVGRHLFAIEAWLDVWGGFCRDLAAKRAAGLNLDLEAKEGRALLAAATGRAQGALARSFEAILSRFDKSPVDQASILLAPEVSEAMAEVDERAFKVRSFIQPVEIDRLAANFSSWYELFPRSQTPEKSRHGNFNDVIATLPRVAAMGFDTLYFPPIHPIGTTNRKGPNNSLAPGPEDVGSPYAIGSEAGGHSAIHPDLGSLQDFRTLLQAARDQGLEIALDFAIQCSPDHPWLKQHPEWFAWRPDGTIKYAENPPKKYQDIVNVDFYGKDAIPDLWEALRDVVLFWAAEGVRTFRVDNPHTKPLPFWAWLIAEVRSRHPDVLFLSEAFTRPNPMYQLAKLGFTQSYTYFIWRNSKVEITEYLTEITKTEVREFFRPHFFVNTPDINPLFLQTSGRAGFLIRAALAATLSGLFGVYSGFELCESAPLPGREEYLDSEKYEIRPRPVRRAGDIVAEISQLNALRRFEPALQTHLGLEFHQAFNDQVLYFSKGGGQSDYRILVAVSLDPHGSQDAEFEIPLWRLDLGDDATVQVEDLLTSRRFGWSGKIQHVRLTPEHPYAIWRITRSWEG
jgi:hypothetical protein